jgi:GNAT superfamily N-acetyltransferase
MRTNTNCLRAVPAGEPSFRTTLDQHLETLVRQPWRIYTGREPLLVRPCGPRDLAAVAQMHRRCSARSLLDRYRSGGRPPAVTALDRMLRRPYGVVATIASGDAVAFGALEPDPLHDAHCVAVGVLVEDGWQRLGLGRELLTHLAGVAQVAGYRELIGYPATALNPAQRLMIEVGRTRMVPGSEAHLHTYLSESATLGLGAVRQRLAG